MEKVIFFWSGGKDSALCLYEIIHKRKKFIIERLITSVVKRYRRVAMHGVREELLDLQAKYLNIPLHKIYINATSSNREYEKKHLEVLNYYHKKGIKRVVFADLFLEDVRAYREKLLSSLRMKPIFPLWGKDTRKLSRKFIKQGFKAVVTCIDLRKLPRQFCGRDFDEDFLKLLPSGVDPCGENGEFHSFVYAGPIFKEEILCRRGKTVKKRKHFLYCDIFRPKRIF